MTTVIVFHVIKTYLTISYNFLPDILRISPLEITAKQLYMILQTKNGYPEVVLASKCETSYFYTTADWLRHEIGISFCNKEKQENIICWQFCFGAAKAMLKYDPSSGISLCPAEMAKATMEDKAAFKMITDTMKGM